jgi:hypothetical protein
MVAMTEITGPYVNHIGSTVDGEGTIFSVITQDGSGSGDTDVIIKRCLATADPANKDSWIEVKRWTEKIDGKPGYGTAEIRKNGLFVAILSQRNAAGQVVTIVRTVAGIAAPWPAPAAGGEGGYAEAQGGFVRIHAGPLAHNQQITINLADYGIPSTARPLNIRLCAVAPTIGAELRIGPNTGSSGAAMLTAVTQAVNLKIFAEGDRAPGPGHTLILWASKGDLSQAYADVNGWSYS